ncbi:MAG: SGNH/GDSL hydrolase family protein [Vicinamibacterales bacterium]
MTGQLGRKTVAVLAGLFVALLTLEVALRVRGDYEREVYDAVYQVPSRCHDEIPYVLKANLANARGRGLALLSTDSLGLRSNAVGTTYAAKKVGEFRIGIAGDSVTFGEGVWLNEDTYAQVLQRALRERWPSRQTIVFNYGVSAYSVQQMAATLECRMLEVEPDLVVMALLAPDLDLRRLPRRLDHDGHFRSIGWGLGPTATFLLDPLRNLRVPYWVRWTLFPRAVTLSPEIRARIRRDEVPDSYRYVRRFRDFAVARHVPYVVVVLPWLGPSERLVSQLRDDRMVSVDLSGIRAEFTREQFRASRFDNHPSVAVHRRIGEELSRALDEMFGDEGRDSQTGGRR